MPDWSHLVSVEVLYVDPRHVRSESASSCSTRSHDGRPSVVQPAVDVRVLPGMRASKNFLEGSGFVARLLVMHRKLPGSGVTSAPKQTRGLTPKPESFSFGVSSDGPTLGLVGCSARPSPRRGRLRQALRARWFRVGRGSLGRGRLGRASGSPSGSRVGRGSLGRGHRRRRRSSAQTGAAAGGLGGRGGRGGRAERSGFGGGGIDSPSSGARAGRLPAATLALRRISPDGSSGRPSGWIWRRIGEAVAASRMASQRSIGVLAVIAAPALVASRSTSAAGKRAVGSGGWAERRSAWRTRPSSRAVGDLLFPVRAELGDSPVQLFTKLAVQFPRCLVARHRGHDGRAKVAERYAIKLRDAPLRPGRARWPV